MRKLLAFGVLAASLTLSTVQAQGLRPGLLGIVGSGGGSVLLLMNNGVLEEIKATDEQKAKLVEKVPGLMLKFRDARNKVKDVASADQKAKLRQAMREFEALAEKEFAAILKPDQMKRLKQIERQQSVALTLMNDENASQALQVSEDQRDKLKEFNDESIKEINQLYLQMNKDNADEIQAKVTMALREANERSLNALTEAQRTKWKELIGERYEVKMTDFHLGFLGKKK